MEGASSSFNFNFAKRDIQLLNESKFRNSEENENFSNNDSDNDSDANWESFDKQAFNELPELEQFVFNQGKYIKAQIELEQEIIISDENDDYYQDDIEKTLFSSPPLPSSSPSPPLISTEIPPLPIPTEIPPLSIPTETPPPTHIEEQNKPICETTSTTLLSLCILVDLVDGKLQTCGRTENIKNICQLVGIWKIDTNAVIEFEADQLALG
ncbi:15992_t:CDS:1, partial [Funneliformis caledonium]